MQFVTLALAAVSFGAACNGGTTGSDQDGSIGTGADASVDANLTEAPPPDWANVTSNLAGMSSECGNLTMISSPPNSTMVIAGVAHRGLFATTDGGATWNPLGTGSGSDEIINRPSSFVYDPVHTDTFWESGIYSGGGVFRTDDGGATFSRLGNISHDDMVAVDLADPMRLTLLASGHEQKQTLYRSTDGGATWNNVGANLPAGSHFSSYPLIISSQIHLVGACGWGSGECGIWRTTNGGQSWTKVSDRPGTFAPRRMANGTIFWPINGGGMLVSTDDGASWPVAVEGTIKGIEPVVLPDGRIVSIGGGHLMISSDARSWSQIGKPLPYDPAGLSYSDRTKTFFIWHWDCGAVVLDDAIMRAGFDYLKE
jgi:photosystem II stability/assembly factor-like uncharacterized protein